MSYRALSVEEAIEYVKEKGLFNRESNVVSREIGDGNLNLVFHFIEQETGKGLIVKQALPYARVVGESWPLTLDRARIEAEALSLEGKYAPGLVPEVYGYDEELALTIMEDLSRCTILRKGLIERNRYPRLAEDIGRFLAHTLFHTTDIYLGGPEKKAIQRQFINPELCKITEDLVFTDPYFDAETNNFNPLLREDVAKIWQDNELKLEVAELKNRFYTEGQALIHGDLHTGSIMVTESETKVIDPEFAFFGPIGFDIGAVIANLFLNYAAQQGLTDQAACDSYRGYLIDTVKEVWHQFEQNFRRLWEDKAADFFVKTPGVLDRYLDRIFADTIGFAGCKMIRRVIGLASVADLESIEDPAVRAEAERLALQLGRGLIVNRRAFTEIEQVTDWAAASSSVSTAS
ncbi:S-methyl-5-thioribose kinase [Aneurinibacillus terranovensis]|uniref:S-methyl-5-thioribose kinase n=1 Tax=Aneurinibacillus terranovensis TaxID=278991 RepID=UPI00040A62D4|nr:S-methyl-5-thioribose kinase [Aneurinibacillus terranovensis]